MARRFKAGDEPVPGYKLVEFLGRGGFGEVWKAAGRGVDVALKIIDLGGKTGYKEFKALKLVKLIRHPNLVPIVGFWLTDEDGTALDESQVDTSLSGLTAKSDSALTGTVLVDRPKSRATELIIAMGLGDMSMADRLEYYQKKGLPGIPPSELLDYMQDAARGIDFLNSAVHDLGDGPHSAIRHCDIKPQNMMIVGGAVQVCDFGLARAESDVRLTSAAVSPAYGAPECIDGNLPTPSTDQYSLAVSYVEMRTGSLPFSDPGSYMGVVKAHLTGNLDLDRLPPEEREVIRKATSRDHAERFSSCQKFVKALRQACPSDDSVLPPPLSRPELSPYQATMLSDSNLTGSNSGTIAAPWRTPGSKDTQRLVPGKTPLSDSWRTRGTDRDTHVERRKGIPLAVKLLGLLIVVGAAAGGLGAWYYAGGEARAERAKIEAFKFDVATMAKDGKYAEAFARLDEAPSGMAEDEKAWLRNDQIYQPWLDTLKKNYTTAKSLPLEDRGTQLATVGKSLDDLLNAYPRSEDAGNLRVDVFKDIDDIAPQIVEQFRKRIIEILQAKKYDEALTFVDGLPASISKDDRESLRSDIRDAWLPDVRAVFDAVKDEPDRAKKLVGLEQVAANLAEMRKHFVDDAAVKALETQVQSKLAPLKGGSKIAEHIDQAESDWRDKKWTEVRKSLHAAREAAKEAGREDEDGDRITEFQQLTVLADSENPTDLRAAVDFFRKHLQEGSLERLPELAEAIKLLAARQPEFVADATELARLIRELAEASQDGGLSSSAGETYKALLLERVLAAIDSTGPIDYEQLRGYCDEAIAEEITHPMVRLCQAECLVAGKASGAEKQQARSAIALIKDPVEPKHELYTRFVRIAINATAPSPTWKQTGDHLDTIVAGLGTSPWGLRSPTRLAQLAKLLGETAHQHRLKQANTGTVIAKLQANPFGSAPTAQRVFNWLEAANRLKAEHGPEEPNPALVLLHAMAAGNAPNPATDVVAGAVTNLKLLDLKPQRPSSDERHLLYLHGRLQPANASGQLARMQAFSRLLDYELRSDTDPEDVLPIYNELIHPLLAIPLQMESLSAGDRSMLARLYAAKGQFIRHHPYTEWPFEDKLKQGYEAYQTAVKLDPGNPEYIVGKGLSAIALDRDQYEAEAERCAKEAIEKAGKYAGGFALKSNLLLRKARQQVDADEREKLFAETYQAAKRAKDLATRSDPDYATYFVRFATTSVEWANWIVIADPREQMRRQEELLLEAVAAAETAREEARLYRENALRALGNAYEDLVWVVDRRNPDRFHYYDKAIKAFTEAIEARGGVADQYLDRGRCYYKRVADSGEEATYLDLALRDVRAAVETKPDLASAHRWLAKIYREQNEPKLADEAAKTAKELAGKNRLRNRTDYQLYALEWAAFGSTSGQRQTRGDALLAEVQQQADAGEEIDRRYRNRVVLFRGEEIGHKDQIKLYEKYLPADPKQWTAHDVPLAISRINCVLQTTKNVDLIAARSNILGTLEDLYKLADSDADRVDAMKAAAFLCMFCARDRTDEKSKLQDRQESIDYFKRALSPAKSLPSDKASTLWKDYGLAIYMRMRDDPQLAKNEAWRKSLSGAFERAESLARSSARKAAIRKEHKDYASSLDAVK